MKDQPAIVHEQVVFNARLSDAEMESVEKALADRRSDPGDFIRSIPGLRAWHRRDANGVMRDMLND